MAETTYKKGELLLDETVVIEAGSSYNLGIFQTQRVLTEETIIIIFNDVEYICEAIHAGETSIAYGGIENGIPSFTNYPFSIFNDEASSSQIIIVTESPGTYSVKMYVAISDSDSSSEPVTIRSYIDKNLTNLNWNILPQIFESEGVELTEEIKRYLRETPKNTNWNVLNGMEPSNIEEVLIDIEASYYIMQKSAYVSAGQIDIADLSDDTYPNIMINDKLNLYIDNNLINTYNIIGSQIKDYPTRTVYYSDENVSTNGGLEITDRNGTWQIFFIEYDYAKIGNTDKTVQFKITRVNN